MRAWAMAACFVGGLLGALLLVAPAQWVFTAISTHDSIRVFTDGTNGERMCQTTPTVECVMVLTPWSIVGYAALALAGGVALAASVRATALGMRWAAASAALAGVATVAMNIWPQALWSHEGFFGVLAHDPGVQHQATALMATFLLIAGALLAGSFALTRPTSEG